MVHCPDGPAFGILQFGPLVGAVVEQVKDVGDSLLAVCLE